MAPALYALLAGSAGLGVYGIYRYAKKPSGVMILPPPGSAAAAAALANVPPPGTALDPGLDSYASAVVSQALIVETDTSILDELAGDLKAAGYSNSGSTVADRSAALKKNIGSSVTSGGFAVGDCGCGCNGASGGCGKSLPEVEIAVVGYDYVNPIDARMDYRGSTSNYYVLPYQIFDLGGGVRPIEVDAHGEPTGREVVLPGEAAPRDSASYVLVGQMFGVDYLNPADSNSDYRPAARYFQPPYMILNIGDGVRPYEVDARGEPTGRDLVLPGESPSLTNLRASYVLVGQAGQLPDPYNCMCPGFLDPNTGLMSTLPTFACSCNEPGATKVGWHMVGAGEFPDPYTCLCPISSDPLDSSLPTYSCSCLDRGADGTGVFFTGAAPVAGFAYTVTNPSGAPMRWSDGGLMESGIVIPYGATIQASTLRPRDLVEVLTPGFTGWVNVYDLAQVSSTPSLAAPSTGDFFVGAPGDLVFRVTRAGGAFMRWRDGSLMETGQVIPYGTVILGTPRGDGSIVEVSTQGYAGWVSAYEMYQETSPPPQPMLVGAWPRSPGQRGRWRRRGMQQQMMMPPQPMMPPPQMQQPPQQPQPMPQDNGGMIPPPDSQNSQNPDFAGYGY